MSRGNSGLAASEYAEIAVKEAEKAKNSGTFGVGGLLIDNNGAIRKVIGNKVIRNNSIHDPTAHVERQLVDWYFLNKDSLPPASKMIVVVSLDPCMMCSGAILTGGFNIIHVSQDSEAGINCRGLGDFSTLPETIRQKAQETFSTFGVSGKKPFSGSNDSIFFRNEIDGKLDQRSIRAFSSSLKKVKGVINNHHGQSPNELINPRILVAKARLSRVLKLLKKYNSTVFSEGHVIDFDRPGIELGHVLVKKAIESYKISGVFNSACLVDPFGNILLLEGAAEDASPIRTPFMELVRKYHKLLIEAGAEGRKYFAHLKYCKTILLLGPGQDSNSMMEAGCFCSSIEGGLPKSQRGQLQYAVPQQKQDSLQSMLSNLPPLCSDIVRIGDAVQEVADMRLQQFCKSKASQYLQKKNKAN